MKINKMNAQALNSSVGFKYNVAVDGLFVVKAELVDLVRGDARLESEEWMDGLPFYIESSDSRGRQHRHLLFGGVMEKVQQCWFACARSTCNEDAPVAIFHDIESAQ